MVFLVRSIHRVESNHEVEYHLAELNFIVRNRILVARSRRMCSSVTWFRQRALKITHLTIRVPNT